MKPDSKSYMKCWIMLLLTNWVHTNIIFPFILHFQRNRYSSLDTKKNKAYTDLRKVKGINRLQEINCYEQRFKPIRDKQKNREYNVKYCQEHKEENARRQREYRARLKSLKEDKK